MSELSRRPAHAAAAVAGPSAPSERVGHVLDVAVSVASHGSTDALVRCLRSLPSACQGLAWTATAVLNVPAPFPTELLEEFDWLRLVRNDRPVGFGENHNAVLAPIVAAGSARYVLVLNDDTELRPGAVVSLVARADARPSAGALGPRMVWPDGTTQPSLFTFPTPLRALVSTIAPRVPTCAAIEGGPGWLGGACLLLRVDALRQVGLFDPRFFLFFEDVDLCRRLLDDNWTNELWTEAVIVHDAHHTVSRAHLSLAMECQMLRSAYLYNELYHGRAVAGALSVTSRAMFVARAGVSAVAELARGRRSHPSAAGRNLRLAAYRPTRMLRHEVADLR